MSRADAVLAVGKLVAAFRQEKIPKETVEIYVDQLSHLTPRTLQYAIEQAIRSSRYFPAVADVLDRAGECPPPPQRYLNQGAPPEISLPPCPSCGEHFAIIVLDPIDGSERPSPCLWCVVAEREGKKVVNPNRRGDAWEGPEVPPEPEVADEDVPPPAEVS